jgi:transposase
MDSMEKKPRQRRSFTAEFRAEIVELCQRGDRSIGQVAKDLDLTETTVRGWVKRAERVPATLAGGEHREVAELWHENRRPEEDEILGQSAPTTDAEPSRAVRVRAAYDDMSTGVRIVSVLLTVVAIPLAAPTWAIEFAIRKSSRRSFEFQAATATPYFFIVALSSTAGVIFVTSVVVQIMALYILADMELVCLVTCVVIALINPGPVQTLLRAASRRRTTFRPQVMAADPKTIFIAIISAGYSIWFFGALSFALWRADHSYFGGVYSSTSQLYVFWEFIQNSFQVLTNSSASLIAERFLSQLLADFEFIVGIFLVVFLLTILVSSWASRALENGPPLSRPE